MNTYGRLRCFAALGALAPSVGNTRDGSTDDVHQHRVSDDGVPAERRGPQCRPQALISRDPAGGWVKGKVSGSVLDPSADWARIIPSDALRIRLDARVLSKPMSTI